MTDADFALALDVLFDSELFPRRLRPAVESRVRRAVDAVWWVEKRKVSSARLTTIASRVAVEVWRDHRMGTLEREIRPVS